MDVSTFTAHRRSLDTPAGEIAYTELGSGPVALFVHGLGTNGVLWRHVIENLRDTSRCIAIDLPLHGGTPGRDDLSVTALAQVVADLCDGLEQGFLPSEVVVERAAADPRGRQHGLDRGALVPVLGEQPGGHLDELAAGGTALGCSLT